MRPSSALFVLIGLTTIACSGGSSSSSKSEFSERNTDPDDRSARMQGQAAEGSAGGTVEVSVAASGQVVGEGDIDASGRYIADVAADMENLVVRAYDTSGSVTGEVLVGASGAAESTTTAAPMTSETSVEAEVYVAAHADASGATVAMADLRGRLDAEVAAAVDAAAEREQEVEALAQGILAAQAAEARALAEFGGEAGSDFEPATAVSVQMMAEVDAALDSGLSAEEADRWFIELEEDAAEAQGIGLGVLAEAEASAGIAFRMTLDGLAEGGSAAEETAEEGARRSGELEARLAAEVSVWTATSAELSSDAIDLTEDAANELEAEAQAAAERDAAAEVWADFEARIVGDVEGGLTDTSVILQMMTDADATVAAEISAAVEASLAATEVLITGLEEAQAAWEPAMSPEATATAVVELRTAYHAAIDSDSLSADAQAAAELTMWASGGFASGDDN